MRTLLLDNTYHPVRVIDWQKAMILILTGRAEILDEYQDVKIRAPQTSFVLPKILRMYSRYKGKREIRFCRNNVYWRDNYTCQYCYNQFPTQHLTFDHIVPVSKGGNTNWENVVTCCTDCNCKKANKNLQQSGFKLMKKPKKPKFCNYIVLKLKTSDPPEWFDWIPLRVERIT